MPRKIG